MSSTELLEELIDFVGYIIKTYGKALKIVEVGVGRFCEIAVELKRRLPKVEVVVTDINIEMLSQARRRYSILKVVQDNVIRPNIEVYKDAELIYSIRAPPELWPALVELANRVQADLMVRPLPTETPMPIPTFRLVNFGKARFYTWHPSIRRLEK